MRTGWRSHRQCRRRRPCRIPQLLSVAREIAHTFWCGTAVPWSRLARRCCSAHRGPRLVVSWLLRTQLRKLALIRRGVAGRCSPKCRLRRRHFEHSPAVGGFSFHSRVGADTAVLGGVGGEIDAAVALQVASPGRGGGVRCRRRRRARTGGGGWRKRPAGRIDRVTSTAARPADPSTEASHADPLVPEALGRRAAPAHLVVSVPVPALEVEVEVEVRGSGCAPSALEVEASKTRRRGCRRRTWSPRYHRPQTAIDDRERRRP
jgi:hypothetical protein